MVPSVSWGRDIHRQRTRSVSGRLPGRPEIGVDSPPSSTVCPERSPSSSRRAASRARGVARRPPGPPAADPAEHEPGLGDLEAAVGLVSAGLATRVVLTGFPSWPGLLWHAYRLAESANVLILPTVVRPGGRVDIVITRDSSANG